MLENIKYIFRQRRARGISVAKGRIIARRFAIGSALLSLFVYWLHPTILERIDVRIRDVVFQVREAPPPPPEVVLVTIDEASVKNYGRWPWSRAVQGKLIRKLKQMGAGVIALDVVYSLTQSPAQDRVLVYSLNYRGAPVIGGYFFRDEQSVKISARELDNVRRSKIGMIFEGPDSRKDTVAHYPYVEPNHHTISPHFFDLGFFNSIPDADGLVRSAPLVLRFEGNFYPSLPLQALSVGLEQDIFIELDLEGVRNLRLGDIEIPVNAQGRMALNFYNGQTRIPRYSASDVLDGLLPSEAVRGKLIFVGVTETGIADVRPTPIDHSFPGVEIHATVAANILQGFHLYFDNRTLLIDIFMMLFFPLTMAWGMSKLTRPLLMTVIFFVTSGCVWIIYFISVSGYGLLISIFYPMVSVVIGYLVFVSYEIFISDTKTRYMRRAMSSYVSPKLVSRLISDPDSLVLRGEKREVSVLFSDIRGFTTLSEGMTPEALVLLLNDYLGPMTEIVMKNDGTLDKYIGDAVMAIYNAPMDIPDHAECAARSAIIMQKSLLDLNKIFEKDFGRRLKIGIGIHTGDAVVGNMGSQRRFNYTAMGDTVNLASRLEGRTKYYQVDILISKSTNDKLGDTFLRRHLDRIRVKGKHLPVDIYQLFVDSTSEESHDLKIKFEHALELYFEGKFPESLREFRELQESYPDDHPTQTYIERCQHNIEEPPEGEWDGVFIMTEK